MSLWFVASLIATFLVKSEALQCYHCTSTKSWEDCFKILRNETCARGMERCITSEAKVKVDNRTDTSYMRACAKNCDVESNPICQIPGITCKIECCVGDLCNNGKKDKEPSAQKVNGSTCTEQHNVSLCTFVLSLVWLLFN
ncbi:hypothetical protein AC249_AIPGENE26379 [Exaiptasia diaphana]|nr:hypothetical protein AC249_AIPGENE26379 [Exaiptasia diaphana]